MVIKYDTFIHHTYKYIIYISIVYTYIIGINTAVKIIHKPWIYGQFSVFISDPITFQLRFNKFTSHKIKRSNADFNIKVRSNLSKF